MGLSTKSELILFFMMPFWLVQLIGVVNFGIGDAILLLTLFKVWISMMKLLTLNGVLINRLFLHPWAKMAAYNFGKKYFMQGFIKKEYVGPNLHYEITKQAKIST
jgi:hypothetical protein